MHKIIVASFVLVAFNLVLNTLPVFAHEGTAQEHLILGFGAGEVVGLLFGVIVGGLTVLAFSKYRNSKSGK